MKNFREWLSDYLRYFILAIVIILVIVVAILGLNIYSKTFGKDAQQAAGTETQPQIDVRKETDETKATERSSETQKETQSESATESQSETQSETQTETPPQTEAQNDDINAQAAPELQNETQPQTQPPTEYIPETDPPEPVYKNLTGACYLRAGTSKESEILGEYSAGTTVEYLGEESGWAKVRVDGMTGYMGPQFF